MNPLIGNMPHGCGEVFQTLVTLARPAPTDDDPDAVEEFEDWDQEATQQAYDAHILACTWTAPEAPAAPVTPSIVAEPVTATDGTPLGIIVKDDEGTERYIPAVGS